ncbi:hypothetical protein TcCL_Unassigned03575 [Trypanosoma cruzi]|nr:hypothetical protein TcCL_Unassigned03575 [Trypanosoma cruzi]
MPFTFVFCCCGCGLQGTGTNSLLGRCGGTAPLSDAGAVCGAAHLGDGKMGATEGLHGGSPSHSLCVCVCAVDEVSIYSSSGRRKGRDHTTIEGRNEGNVEGEVMNGTCVHRLERE